MGLVDLPQIKKEDLCYQNNIKLKRANVRIPYTHEQLNEFVRCQEDPVYFIKNYVYIVSLDKGLTLFDMYDYQVKMINEFINNRFSINLLSRQMGKTTVVAAYLLWEGIFKENMRIAILANKGDTAREILSRLKAMFEDLPWFLKPGVVEWNKGSIELSNGTKIISAATSSSSIRGQSMNIIYLDEFAFVNNDVEFYTSTYPVISSGKTTKVIITSTPNGMNLFYKLWADAMEGRNLFIPNKVLWYEHPDRDNKWKEETIKNIGEQQFRQEYECEFIGSSNTLISGEKLQQLTFEEPIESDENLLVYNRPEEGHQYVIVVDTSEGIGKDYSVANVIDITSQPYTQVALFRSNVVPVITLTDIVYRLGKKYNEAYVIIENNGIGKVVVDSLHYDYEYENILSTKVKHKEEIISNDSLTLGIRTTKRTKMIGCSTLKMMIESDTLIIKDFQTISELFSFVKVGSSYKAEKGKSDDIAMTLVIFSWLVNENYFEELSNINTRDILRKKLTLQEEEFKLNWFFDDGLSSGEEELGLIF